MQRTLSTLAAGLFLLAPAQDSRLSKGQENELRGLFTEALLEGQGRALSKLVSQGEKLQKKVRSGDLIEALRKGPRYPSGDPEPRGKGKDKEQFETFDGVLTGLSFEVDGERYPYVVRLPRGYDPDQPTPLLLDPGHGAFKDRSDEEKAGLTGYYANQARGAGFEDWLVVRSGIVDEIGAGGRRGGRPEDEVGRVFQGLFRDLVTRFNVDLDRIYAAGLSQTGFWAWYLGRARADRLAGIAPMGAVTWQADRYLANYLTLPVYVLHGDQDDTCAVEQPRRTCPKLEELGGVVHYQEVPGGLHDFSTWGKLNEGLRWLWDRGPRDPYPKRVVKALCSEEDPWCYWIRVEGLSRKGSGKAADQPTAAIEGAIDGQTIRITSEGVKGATLCLSSEMLDLDAPITVLWNDKPVFEGTVERDFGRTLEVAVEKADWRGTFEAFLELKAKR